MRGLIGAALIALTASLPFLALGYYVGTRTA